MPPSEMMVVLVLLTFEEGIADSLSSFAIKQAGLTSEVRSAPPPPGLSRSPLFPARKISLEALPIPADSSSKQNNMSDQLKVQLKAVATAAADGTVAFPRFKQEQLVKLYSGSGRFLL